MKQTLSAEDRKALVKYRIERAYDTLKEADYNAKGGLYNIAMNRLYYACYYAASAALISIGVSTQTHSAVRTMLALHFVKDGKLAKKHLTTLTLLFHNRQSSDYDDFICNDKQTFDENRILAQECVDAIGSLLVMK
jgi:uncharacterized protein (UPF0332 family)